MPDENITNPEEGQQNTDDSSMLNDDKKQDGGQQNTGDNSMLDDDKKQESADDKGDKGGDSSMLDDDKKDDKKDGEDDDKKDKKDDPRAPEKYEIKLPEGMEGNEEEMKGFTDFARENDMSNEQAQKALDYYFQKVDEANKETTKAFAEQRQGWRKAVNEDAKLGTKEGREKVMEGLKFASPELQTMIKKSWMGDHPLIQSLLYDIGAKLAEDKEPGGDGNGSTLSDAEVIYGKN